MNRPTTHYYLPKHIYICLIDNHLVFLDLKRDKYICLNNTQSESVCSFIENQSADLETQNNDRLCATLQLLAENGLFTIEPDAGKDISPIFMKHPSRDLMGYGLDKKPTIHFKHIFHFLWSCLISAVRLRLLSLDHIVYTMEKRKQFHQRATKQANTENIHDIVEIFNLLRPLIFTAKNNCMYDALSLIEFLSHYGVYTTWTFGVRMGPFVAHCWVQHEDVALNDSVDHIASFTPIMAI